MKKKFFGNIAALGLAGITALPSLCIVSTAQTYAEAAAKIKQSHKYASDVAYQDADGIWYPNLDALKDATGSAISTARHATPDGGLQSYSSSNIYFNTSTGYYTSNNVSGSYKVAGYVSEDISSTYYVPTSARYASDISYLGANGIWYPNAEALYMVTGESAIEIKIPEIKFSEKYHYFDPGYGYYVSSRTAEYIIDVSSGTSYISGYNLYYSTHTEKYYATYSEALTASENDPLKVADVSNYITGYYYNGKYYDPYHYYLLMQQGGNTVSSDTSAPSVSSTGSSVTINSTSGWATVADYIAAAESGKTISVNMKDETVIPSTVTSALKGKNVTLKLKLSNGTIYTINGNNISTAKVIRIKSEYNTNNVPSKLVKAAYKKKNAVSTAQLTVSNNSFGAKVGITVKFAAKRAGCMAFLYRYNESKNSLSLIDSSTVNSSGQCTFDGIAKGGDFVIVLS